MAVQNHVENPFEYVLERLSWTWADIGRAVRAAPHVRAALAPPAVRRITAQDLLASLRKGAADLGATRDDVLFLAVIYPLAGLLMGGLAFRYNLLPMIFPLASGFAILGPLAAVGLYEMSRRREAGEAAGWSTGFAVLRSPRLGSILGLGAILMLIFAAWLAAAYGIYAATLGPAPPRSVGGFLHDVFATGPGWAMIAIGVAVGFVFAAVAFAVSVVSFPLLLEHDVSMAEAIATSARAVRANPGAMALWGLIVAAALVVGSLPALVGLIFVVPVLGHATWHLYRRTIEAPHG
ncbi:MAG: DUF2189 domain-containing protein [Alphaproteobacteria bacterium]|nr:DUF2189 domain-containing protein [Alphaproteobacteria bacterium]